MAVWSEITKSGLEDETRLDAEYYTPDKLFLASELDCFESEPLGRYAHITDGQHGYFELDEKSTVRQITAKDITNGLVYRENADRLSLNTHNKNLRSSLKAGDVLVSTAGTIGRVGYVTEDVPPANIDQDIGRICIRNHSEINPLFLWLFLQTRFGKFQMERSTTGQVQTHLSLAKLRRIRILRPAWQKEIVDLGTKSISKRKESESLYTQAQQLLESELGLDKLEFEKPVGYEANYSEVINNSRTDADYYQPKYKDIRQVINDYRFGCEPLINCATAISPNINPMKNPTESYQYIELANINPTLGVIEQSNTIYGKDAPSRARRLVQKGDILASAVVGSVDKAALVGDEHHDCLASTGFFHFRPNNISSEFLLILVRSKLVTMQMQQEATGGILSAVPDTRLKNIVIPSLPENLKQEISRLVEQSYRNYHKSKQLLEQAKHRVEQLIEEAVTK